ncbi:MAG: MopE-related protein, partial [Acidobacteriota bacterium]
MGVGGRDTGKWPGGGPGLLLLALLAGAAGIGPAQAVCTDCDADGVTFPADCNDADPAIHPGAAEVCDGLDDDCNGLVDDSLFCTGTCVNLAKAGFDLLVSGDAAKSVQPSVAWTGNEYGVAWRDERDLNMEIYFALVSADGVKLTGDLRITNDAASSFAPALVWTGTEFGVAWVDNRNGNKEIYFNRLDAAGLTAGADVRLTADAGTSIQPSLVWTGAEYGVAWTDDRNGNREITFNRLDETGAVLGSDVRVTNDAAVSEQPALVWNGAGYGLVWTDERDGNREIYFNLLGSTGTTAGADIRLTADAAVSAQPSLAWSGSAYGVAWVDERDGNREIYFAGLDAAGAKQAPETRLTVDLAVSEQPSLDWTGQEYGVAWRDTRAINGEIFLARVDPSGSQQGATLRISNDLGLVSRAPDLVWSGTRHAVVWQDIEVNLSRVDCSCEDADMDGISACKDCNDQFAACTTTCTDVDVDGWPICAGDCDDTNAAIFPAAPQVCDGLNNDCNDPAWPALTGTNEADADGDAFSACTGDCDDTNAAIFPAAPQVCDGL